MKRKLFISTIFSIVFYFAHGQNLKFGTTLNFGFSKIDLSTSSRFGFSGNVGFVIEKQINKENRIGTELLFLKMQGVERETDESFSVERRTFIDYFGFSIYYGQQLNKLSLRFGLQPIIPVHSVSFRHFYFNSGTFFNRESSIGLPKIELGIKLGIDYEVTKAIRFKLDFFQGILKKSDRGSDIRRNPFQLTLGVFSFFN